MKRAFIIAAAMIAAVSISPFGALASSGSAATSIDEQFNSAIWDSEWARLATEKCLVPTMQDEAMLEDWLLLFEPDYCQVLHTTHNELLNEHISVLLNTKLGDEFGPGSTICCGMVENSLEIEDILISEIQTSVEMSAFPGYSLHARLVVFDPETLEVISSEMYEGKEHLRISSTLDRNWDIERYAAIAIGYAFCDGKYGPPVVQYVELGFDQ